MEIDVDIPDDLFVKAQKYSGIVDPSALANEALRALVDREKRRARGHAEEG